MNCALFDEMNNFSIWPTGSPHESRVIPVSSGIYTNFRTIIW